MRGRGGNETQGQTSLRSTGVHHAAQVSLISGFQRAVIESEYELALLSGQIPANLEPPMSPKELGRYSDFIISNGSQIKPGDHLLLNVSADEAELAVAAALQAYSQGARRVTILTDGESVQDYGNLLQSILPPDFNKELALGSAQEAAHWTSALDDGAAVLQLNNGAIGAQARDEYWKRLDDNAVRWTVAYWPTPTLAEQVYGNDPQAEQKLAQDILYMTRCSEKDGPDAGHKHLENLRRRADLVNSLDIDEITIEDPEAGTSTTFGLLNTSKFTPCAWETKDGESFACNLPSEEIFCTPDPSRTNGDFRATRPFNHNDLTITQMQGKFVDGELQREGFFVTSSDANADPDALADEMYTYLKDNPGMLHVGELALIGNDSRIGKLNRMYGIDNIDENSGCHFALGESFLAGLDNLQEDERRNRNLDSKHIDITIGSANTRITAKTRDGRTAVLMNNGEWAKVLLGDVE